MPFARLAVAFSLSGPLLGASVWSRTLRPRSLVARKHTHTHTHTPHTNLVIATWWVALVIHGACRLGFGYPSVLCAASWGKVVCRGYADLLGWRCPGTCEKECLWSCAVHRHFYVFPAASNKYKQEQHCINRPSTMAGHPRKQDGSWWHPQHTKHNCKFVGSSGVNHGA